MVLWWKDRSRLPPGMSPGAQPVWILGQWCFVPFAFGHVPLGRRCSTAVEAEREALHYEERLASLTSSGPAANRDGDVVEELGALRRCDDGGDPGLREGFAIYFAGDPDSDDECLLLKPDGHLEPNIFKNYDDATLAAARLSVTLPGRR